MADLTVDSTIHATQDVTGRFGPVWTNSLTGYTFYKDSGGAMVYRKTTDGGSTWGTPVTSTSDTGMAHFALWFDKWTPNDTGTKIHFIWDGSSFIKYRTLDTSSDTLSSEVTAISKAADGPGKISIAKAEGGNLYILFAGGNSAVFGAGLLRSVNNGASWSTRSSSGSSISTDADEAGKLVPANTDDTNDIAMVYLDDLGTSTEQFKYQEYDDSADSWSSTSFSSSAGSLQYSVNNFEVIYQHSNKTAHVFWWRSNVTTLFYRRITKIGDLGTLDSINTSISNISGVSGMVDQTTNDLYVFFAADASTRKISYFKSTDGGSTWGTEVDYSDSAVSGYSLPSASYSVGSSGGRLAATWRDFNANDWFYNFDNSIAIAGDGESGFLVYWVLVPGVGPA